MKSPKIQFLATAMLLATTIFITSCGKDAEPTPAVVTFAKVMLVHAGFALPAVDFYIDGIKKNTDSLVYSKNTLYFDVEAGKSHSLAVKRAGTNTLVVDSSSVNLNTDIALTLIAYRDSAGKPLVQKLTDDLTPTSVDSAKIRFGNFSLNSVGNSIDFEAVLPGGIGVANKNLFSNVLFGLTTDFARILKGTYDFKLKNKGTSNLGITIGTSGKILEAGKIYTVLAIGDVAKANQSTIMIVTNK